MNSSQFETWLAALEQRHLANLTPPEVTRALRALSSCYVERREKLAGGGALNTAGKRAAFALFYGPQHFVIVREIVRALDAAKDVKRILDLGCGTGSAGAAFAIETGDAQIEGIDRSAWAVAEANWTYRMLRLNGRAVVGDIGRLKDARRRLVDTTILAAYAVNELDNPKRHALCRQLVEAHHQGASVLVVEPIARRVNPWWDQWRDTLKAEGGREDEWRFRIGLPPRQRLLAKAAGLDPQELTARSLYMQASSNIQRP